MKQLELNAMRRYARLLALHHVNDEGDLGVVARKLMNIVREDQTFECEVCEAREIQAENERIIAEAQARDRNK